jgi:hypothetical protein
MTKNTAQISFIFTFYSNIFLPFKVIVLIHLCYYKETPEASYFVKKNLFGSQFWRSKVKGLYLAIAFLLAKSSGYSAIT